MSTVTVEALGGIRFSASTRGHQIFCNPPAGSNGEETSMNPSELFLSALGFCVGVYIVRFCEKHNITTKGMKIQVLGKGTTDPSRFGKILFEIEIPTPVPEELRDAVIRAAKTCYLHNTLNNPPEMDITLK